MEICIRKIGNSKGAVIPAPILKELGLDVGSIASAQVKDGRLVIEKKTVQEYELQDLLAQCEGTDMSLSDEDKAWLEAEPAGKEIL